MSCCMTGTIATPGASLTRRESSLASPGFYSSLPRESTDLIYFFHTCRKKHPLITVVRDWQEVERAVEVIAAVQVLR